MTTPENNEMTTIPVKTAPHEIDKVDPWKDDALKTRRILGQRLMSLIVSQRQPLSICIDGAWGSGKTFFINRWESELKSNDIKVVHFNAWEDDFFDDPMPALVGQLWRDLGFAKDKSALTGTLSTDVQIITSFVWRFVKVLAVHAAEKKFADAFGCTTDQLEKFASEDKTNAGAILDNYDKYREARDEFGKALERLVTANAKNKSSYPCVFVIDELDRCQPLFAVKVLERVKHFLSIPNLVFVFCIDKQNLGKSLTAVYGDIDVDNYLRRVFDFVFPLTTLDKKSFCDSLWEQYSVADGLMSHDAECHEKADCLWAKDENFRECFSFLATFHQLTFREIEYVFRSYLLVLRDNSIQHRRIQPHLLATMLFLRLRNPPLENRFARLECSPADVINELLPKHLEPETAHIPTQLAVAILYAFYPWAKEAELRKPIDDSLICKIIRWSNSLQPPPGAPQTLIPTIPEFVPSGMRQWGYNLKNLSDWTHGIDGEMRMAFAKGNPLVEYEVLVNLMESPPTSEL